MIFEYTAYQDNKLVKEVIDAGSKQEVIQFLKAKKIFPVEIKQKKSSIADKFQRIFNRTSFKDVVYFTRQVSIMLNAGLTLLDTLSILQKQTGKQSMKELLEDIINTIRAGENFSTALQKHPDKFSKFYIALVKSGEASGKLDLILNKLADNLERQKEFRGKIRNAMIYPITIILAMAGMIFAMFTFVVPRLTILYGDFNVELPLPTRLLISISTVFQNFWILMVMAAAAVVFAARAALKTEKGKLFFDTNVLRVPVFGNIIKYASLVDTTRTLSILISSGVSIIDSLQIVRDVNTNEIYRKSMDNIASNVQRGVSIGTSMEQEKIYPNSLVQMTIVGEQTGHIDETLGKISEYYQSETETSTKTMLTLLEPMILVVLGLVVGGIVVAIITPIFNLTNSI